MLRRLSAVLLFAAMASAAQAAECSSSLREQWSVTFSEIMNVNRIIVHARNMGESYDLKLLCETSKKIPALNRIANEYYQACDPINAPRDLAMIGQLDEMAAKLRKLRCVKLEEASARKKK